jgi:hypothetical protein
MPTYIALVQPTESAVLCSERVTQTIKDEISIAERKGIKVRDFYWTTETFNAVLVLQTADKNGIKCWRDSLKNLRVELIETVQDHDYKNHPASEQRGFSCEMIHWWY